MVDSKPALDSSGNRIPSSREVFLYFTKLGFINIGGPVAQITMMYNHMVERARWLSKERFVEIMGFAHMLPGPEALQLAIYVGYVKRGRLGGILAGITFIVPGAALMIILSGLYVTYGTLPQVNQALYILKPAVIGIIAAGIFKLGKAAIKTAVLAALFAGSFAAIRFAGMNPLLVLALAGILNLLIAEGTPRLRQPRVILPGMVLGLATPSILAGSRWLQISWLSLKTGLLSFGGAYASLAFLQRGAVEQHQWLTAGQFLDGVALSIATPGPFMLFATFVGFLAGRVAGAILATFFVFLPSFVMVLLGARYMEQLRHNRPVQAFLAGVSAAVVGLILVVSLDLMPEAFSGLFGLIFAVAVFLGIVIFRIDVAYVAIGAMAAGLAYAGVRST